MEKNNIITDILKIKLQLTEKILSILKSNKKVTMYEISKNSLYLILSYNKNYLLNCNINELNIIKEIYVELNNCFKEIITTKEKRQ